MYLKKSSLTLVSFLNGLGTLKVSILLFIFTFTLRLLYLDFYPLNIDEPFTVFYSQMSIDHIGQMLKTENNPPLFFVIMHFWIKAFGISEFSVRFLPALFSSLTVVFIYLFGKEYFSKNVGFVASFLFIFSESHFEYSHDCRAYTLLVFLSTVSIYFLMRLLTGNKEGNNWIGFGICNTLLVYTHFIGWVVIFIQIILIIIEIKRIPIKLFILSYTITLLTLLPYIPIFFYRASESTQHDTWVQKPNLSDLYTRLWDYSNKPLVTVIFIIVLAIGFISIFFQKNKVNVQTKGLLLWFLIPYLGLFVISNKLPLYIERYLLIISVPYYLLLGSFMELFISKNKVFKVLYLLLPAIMLFSTNFNPSRKRPNKQIVELLKTMSTKTSCLMINPDWFEPTFLYYYDISLFKDYANSKKNLIEKNIYPIDSYRGLNEISSQHECSRIIYFQSNPNFVDPQNLNFQYLNSKFRYIASINVYNCRISVFNKK